MKKFTLGFVWIVVWSAASGWIMPYVPPDVQLAAFILFGMGGAATTFAVLRE